MELRIAFIIEFYPPHVGGGETLFSGLAEGLVRRGHQCEVVTSGKAGEPEQEVRNGVLVRRIPVPRTGDRYWYTALALPHALRAAKRADVVHTMTYNAAPPAWVAARAVKRPVVMQAHEVLGRTWREAMSPASARFHRMAEAGILSLPYEAHACNSLSTKLALTGAGVDRKRLHLIYPGVDRVFLRPPGVAEVSRAREQWAVAEDAYIVLYFGRPGVARGVEDLLRAWPEVRHRVPQAVLVLVLAGDPTARRARIASMAGNLGPEACRVLDPVPRDELPAHVAAADCVAVPSLSEGFGFSAAEACALGVPVVATTAGSLPEVVSGRHLFVPCGDPRALASGLVRASRGDYEYSPPRTFTWDRAVEAYETLYGSLAG
ncbi:MAG: glycosyltransferase family 4 protein [Desulfatibacillaceae bacterium]